MKKQILLLALLPLTLCACGENSPSSSITYSSQDSGTASSTESSKEVICNANLKSQIITAFTNSFNNFKGLNLTLSSSHPDSDNSSNDYEETTSYIKYYDDGVYESNRSSVIKFYSVNTDGSDGTLWQISKENFTYQYHVSDNVFVKGQRFKFVDTAYNTDGSQSGSPDVTNMYNYDEFYVDEAHNMDLLLYKSAYLLISPISFFAASEKDYAGLGVTDLKETSSCNSETSSLSISFSLVDSSSSLNNDYVYTASLNADGTFKDITIDHSIKQTGTIDYQIKKVYSIIESSNGNYDGTLYSPKSLAKETSATINTLPTVLDTNSVVHDADNNISSDDAFSLLKCANVYSKDVVKTVNNICSLAESEYTYLSTITSKKLGDSHYQKDYEITSNFKPTDTEGIFAFVNDDKSDVKENFSVDYSINDNYDLAIATTISGEDTFGVAPESTTKSLSSPSDYILINLSSAQFSFIIDFPSFDTYSGMTFDGTPDDTSEYIKSATYNSTKGTIEIEAYETPSNHDNSNVFHVTFKDNKLISYSFSYPKAIATADKPDNGLFIGENCIYIY
jgi:hypothetical protein